MLQIQLNITSFKLVIDNQTFAFYGVKQKGFAPIYWDMLYESFPKSAGSILVKQLSNINWESVSQ